MRDPKLTFLIRCAYGAVWLALIWLMVRYVLVWLLPFLIALALAALLEPAVVLCRRRLHLRRGFTATVLSLVVLGTVAAGLVLLAMVLPQLYLSIVGLVNAVPEYIRIMQRWLLDFLADNPEIQAAVLPYYNSLAQSVEQWLSSDMLPNLESVNSTLDWLKAEILPQLTGVVSSVSSGVIALALLLKDILIAIIVSVYLLARKDVFAAQSKKIVYSVFRTDVADLLVEETRSAYRILSGFINGKLLDSLIIGIIALVCCNLFNFPYPALLAVIIGVTNVIPFFGPFIGAIPCALLILIISPIQCVYFVIFILVLQQFDGNILGPKILGDSTGLASFWVLFSILLFGGLFGFAGMVLGVPVFAMFYSVVSRLVRRGLKKRGYWSYSAELNRKILKITLCSLVMGGVIYLGELGITWKFDNWLLLSYGIKIPLFAGLCILGVATFCVMAKLTGVLCLTDILKMLSSRGKKNAQKQA